ncbi:MAG: hypothetical protein J5501_05070 [Ruminococcus sp.]|nr:hypothetical protein [Ruminococcus sp.]
MKTRRTAVFLAAAMLLSGCTQKQQTPSKVIDTSGFRTIDVPENGWTAEDIISVSYINGNQMKYPVRMSDLDMDYEAADRELTDYSGFRVRCAYNAGRFIHKNLCYFFYDAASLDDISRDTPADEFTVMYSEGDRDNIFVVNGLPIGGSTEQMLSALGEPVKKAGADGVMIYWFTPDDSSFELTVQTSGGTVDSISMEGLNGKKFQKTGVQ